MIIAIAFTYLKLKQLQQKSRENDAIFASILFTLANCVDIRRFIMTWMQLRIHPQQQWLLAVRYGDPTEDVAWKPTEL